MMNVCQYEFCFFSVEFSFGGQKILWPFLFFIKKGLYFGLKMQL